jgi:hypothetical protein
VLRENSRRPRQGNFGSQQGIELENQLLSGKELSLASLAFVLKENELWLVMKALVVNPTQPSGAIFDAANMAIADCLVRFFGDRRMHRIGALTQSVAMQIGG